MAEQGRITLDGYYETGDVPTEGQFQDLIDSFLNRTDDSDQIVPAPTTGDAGYPGTPKPDESGWEVLQNNPLYGKNYYQIVSNAMPSGNMYYKIVNNNILEVLVPIGQSKASKFRFTRNTNDDFIRLNQCEHVTLSESEGKDKVRNADDFNGNINTASAPNYYARDVGDTIKITFEGTGIDFGYLSDDRGGLWEFVLDGYDAGSVEVSTYSASLDGSNRTTLFSGLEDTTHTVIGTFQGDDPDNTPSGGAGTSRGWFYYTESNDDDFYTFETLSNFKDYTTNFKILAGGSNIEYALSSRESGSTNDYEWLPEHNGVGTITNSEEKLFIGDDEITSSWLDFSPFSGSEQVFRPIDSIQLVQIGTGENPNDNTDIAEITTVHSINNRGVSINVEIEFLTDTDVDLGYVGMIPTNDDHGTSIIDNYSNSIALRQHDVARDYFPYRDYLKSIAVINDGADFDKNSTVFAATYYDTRDSFLYNENTYLDDNGNDRRFWVEHRSGVDFNKLYPQTYNSDIVSSGFRHSFAMKMCVGKLKNKFFE